MGKNAQISFRINEEKKNEVEKLFLDLGLSHTAAIDLFYSQILQRKGLPFHVLKTDFKGKDKYELAKRILRVTFNLRDHISYARNPMMLEYEFQPDPEDNLEMKADYNLEKKDAERIHEVRVAFRKRMKPIVELMEKFEVERVEAEILFGTHTREILLPLRSHIHKLNRAIQSYITSLYHHLTRKTRVRDKSEDEVIFEGYSSEDPYKAELLKIVEKIEDLCRSYM